MIRIGHRLSCSLFKGEHYCDCGPVDVVELVDFFVNQATGREPKRAAA